MRILYAFPLEKLEFTSTMQQTANRLEFLKSNVNNKSFDPLVDY